MDLSDLRAQPRIGTVNLISYVCIDSSGRAIDQGMGQALNISQTGILLETLDPIETSHLSLMSFDLNNELMEIRGRVIHCIAKTPEKFNTGIEFIGNQDDIVQFVSKMIRVYYYRKNEIDVEVLNQPSPHAHI